VFLKARKPYAGKERSIPKGERNKSGFSLGRMAGPHGSQIDEHPVMLGLYACGEWRKNIQGG